MTDYLRAGNKIAQLGPVKLQDGQEIVEPILFQLFDSVNAAKIKSLELQRAGHRVTRIKHFSTRFAPIGVL